MCLCAEAIVRGDEGLREQYLAARDGVDFRRHAPQYRQRRGGRLAGRADGDRSGGGAAAAGCAAAIAVVRGATTARVGFAVTPARAALVDHRRGGDLAVARAVSFDHALETGAVRHEEHTLSRATPPLHAAPGRGTAQADATPSLGTASPSSCMAPSLDREKGMVPPPRARRSAARDDDAPVDASGAPT